MRRFFHYFRGYGKSTHKKEDERVCVPKEFGTTFLHFACANDIEDIIKTILDEGVNVNTIDNFGFAPLHLACDRQSLRIVKILLEAGADVNIPTYKGETPLYIACDKGNIDIARMLLQYGAAAALGTLQDDTPLNVACRSRRIDLVSLLLDNNAVRDGDRVDARILRYACENGDLNMIELLIYRIPSLSIDKALHWACDCKNYYLIKALLDMGANINSLDAFGQTPLRIACDKRMFSIVKLLIEKHADVDRADVFGVTPLKAIVRSFRDISLIQLVDAFEVVRLLVDNFADLSSLPKKKDDRLISMLLGDFSARVRARVALHIRDINELKRSLHEYYNQYNPEYDNPLKRDLSNLSSVKDNLNKLEEMKYFAKRLKMSQDYVHLKKKFARAIKNDNMSSDEICNIRNILHEVNKFREDINNLCNTKVIESILLPVKRMYKESSKVYIVESKKLV